MRLPIRTDGLMFLVGGVESVVDFTTGEVSTDKESGKAFFKVHLMVMAPGEAKPEVWSVKVLGELRGVTAGVPVSVVGLAAITWEQGDRHGLAFRADSITPVAAGGSGSSKQAAA